MINKKIRGLGKIIQKKGLTATTGLLPTLDPYDLWASSIGVAVKGRYYKGEVVGKVGAVVVGLIDWLLPHLSRHILKTKALIYPISFGHEVVRLSLEGKISAEVGLSLLRTIIKIASTDAKSGYLAWGLGFPWMSKNGLYSKEMPLITHTPYIMEALLVLMKCSTLQDEAGELFYGTWGFLNDLKIMHSSPEELALSYAPVDEPRMVVNANAYAAFAYSMHANFGLHEVRQEAKKRVSRLIYWIIDQQNDDGSWYYYADHDSGNFIDCFHSCFVVKNLLKIRKAIPETIDIVSSSIEKGWSFIRHTFFDHQHGLCCRFSKRAQVDQFCWDLYDQAEYLGLLIDFGYLDEAREFACHVERKFCRKGDWYCRIDVLGRLWGKGFLRWGIVPFCYHRSRLNSIKGD